MLKEIPISTYKTSYYNGRTGMYEEVQGGEGKTFDAWIPVYPHKGLVTYKCLLAVLDNTLLPWKYIKNELNNLMDMSDYPTDHHTLRANLHKIGFIKQWRNSKGEIVYSVTDKGLAYMEAAENKAEFYYTM